MRKTTGNNRTYSIPGKTAALVPEFVMERDPQVSQLAKSRKIKELTKTVRNMFLNKIKHINVGFDSRTIREFFKICPYPRNLGEFNKKNLKLTVVLKCL